MTEVQDVLELTPIDAWQVAEIRRDLMLRIGVLLKLEGWSKREAAETVRAYAQALAFLTPGLAPTVVEQQQPPKEK